MARKKHDIHYIYKTTCLVTGRYYIGMHSTCNLEDGYLGSGKRLRHSIRKYGKQNHNIEILEHLPSRELLVEAEKKAITSDMITDKNCMNLMSGGTGGFISEEQQRYRSQCAGKKFSEMRKNDPKLDKEYRDNLSNKLSGDKNPMYGKPATIGFTKMKHSDDTKLKMRNKMVGKYDGINHPQYGCCWITKNGENKKIKIKDIDSYLLDDWVKGRKIK